MGLLQNLPRIIAKVTHGFRRGHTTSRKKRPFVVAHGESRGQKQVLQQPLILGGIGLLFAFYNEHCLVSGNVVVFVAAERDDFAFDQRPT